MDAEFARCIGLFAGFIGACLWGAFQSVYGDHALRPPTSGGKLVRRLVAVVAKGER